MKKYIAKRTLHYSTLACAFGAIGATSLEASGFRLNEQSLNATALSSAYIAGARGADSSYYNPANMGFDDNNELEINATMIYIPGFDFTTANRKMEMGMLGQPAKPPKDPIVDGVAHDTIAPVPKLFFKTKSLYFDEPQGWKGNFGISVTTPSGLTMNWGGAGGGFLDDVGIAMIEVNPAVSLTYGNRFSIGGGVRFIYGTGSFNNSLDVPFKQPGLAEGTTYVEQKSNSEAIGVGYNLAATLKITDSTTLAATYRSKVHFDMKGKLDAISEIASPIPLPGLPTHVNMKADLNLSTHLPDTLNVALAQAFGKTLAEFVYEHTFWRYADIFEFAYSNQKFYDAADGRPIDGSESMDDMVLGSVNAADYNAVAMGRGWRNSNAFRLGLTHFYSPKLTLMGSLALDLTPVPQGKDRFGIPDADSYMVGLGARYELWDGKADVGLAYSLSLKDNRKSFIQSKDGLGQLHLVTLGAKYRF